MGRQQPTSRHCFHAGTPSLVPSLRDTNARWQAPSAVFPDQASRNPANRLVNLEGGGNVTVRHTSPDSRLRYRVSLRVVDMLADLAITLLAIQDLAGVLISQGETGLPASIPHHNYGFEC